MKRLFAATLIMGSATVITALIGIVNRKILALYIGPAGVGVLDQLVDFNVLIIGLASFGLGDGIIKYVSEFESGQQTERLRDFLRTIILALAGIAAAVTVALLLLAPNVSAILLNSPTYASLIMLLALTLPCSVLAAVLRSAVNGYHQVRYLALMSVLPAFSILVLAWPLITTWHLLGAVINVVISTVLTLLVACYFFVRSAGRAFVGTIFREGRFRPRLLLLVATFGVVSLIAGFATNQTLIWVRRFIIDALGKDAVGLFSVANSLSDQTLNLVLIALGSYSYARLSAMRDRTEIAHEVNYTLRVVVLVGVALLFLISVFRFWIVPILFSGAFLPATALIPAQSIGDFFKILMWSLGLALLPMGRTRAYLAYWLIWCATFVGLAYAGIQVFGLIGAMYAHIGAHALAGLLLYLDQRRILHLQITPANWKLFASSLILLGTVVVFDANEWYLYPLFLGELALWALFNVTRGERLAVLRIAQARLPLLRQMPSALHK